jgi:hypothetical protein
VIVLYWRCCKLRHYIGHVLWTCIQHMTQWNCCLEAKKEQKNADLEDPLTFVSCHQPIFPYCARSVHYNSGLFCMVTACPRDE